MINQLLNTMYHLNIQIKEVENKTKLVYEPGVLDEQLKEQIKEHKKEIMQRLQENEVAKSMGFLIYHHGLFYEYRYGLGAFLYIERLSNGFVNAWRENYLSGQDKPFKIKVIAKDASFQKAFKDSNSFINWIKNKPKRKVG
ncbi:MAG: hypothetical protein Q8934_15510 [Bacillota bacterium]|nr:hypothetical protein [Bacillota bacterium]